MMDVDELKARFLNLEFDTKAFVLDPEKAITVAKMSGETLPEFIDADHAEFQAVPAFRASLAAGRHLPIEFPHSAGTTGRTARRRGCCNLSRLG